MAGSIFGRIESQGWEREQAVQAESNGRTENCRDKNEIRRMRTLEDTALRIRELRKEHNPNHLLALLQDILRRVPELLEGIVSSDISWLAAAFARNGDDRRLGELVRDVADDRRLREGLTQAAVARAVDALPPEAAAYVIYMMAEHEHLRSAITPAQIEKTAAALCKKAETNNFVLIAAAAHKVKEWRAPANKAAKGNGLSYAFRLSEQTGSGNALILFRRGDDVTMSILHSNGYKHYQCSLKPEKVLKLLSRPVEVTRSRQEAHELRQDTAAKFRGAMQELAAHTPRNKVLREKLKKLDHRIKKLGLTAE